MPQKVCFDSLVYPTKIQSKEDTRNAVPEAGRSVLQNGVQTIEKIRLLRQIDECWGGVGRPI